MSASETGPEARLRFPGVRAPRPLLGPETERRLTTRQREVLDELEWPHSRGFAAPGSVEVLETIVQWLSGSERRMPVPTSLLVDAAGGLRVVYSGPVDADRLLADAGLSETSS